MWISLQSVPHKWQTRTTPDLSNYNSLGCLRAKTPGSGFELRPSVSWNSTRPPPRPQLKLSSTKESTFSEFCFQELKSWASERKLVFCFFWYSNWFCLSQAWVSWENLKPIMTSWRGWVVVGHQKFCSKKLLKKPWQVLWNKICW